MLQPADASLIIDTRDPADTWCVYEHQAVLQPEQPPVTILVGAAKLTEVFRLLDGKTNTEWVKIYKNGGSVLVRIVGLTKDKQTAYRRAQEMVRDMDPKPICNLHGYNIRGVSRAVICLNNGQRYRTQTEAATALGIHASALSRHLRGELSHAQGLRFAYAPQEERA